MPEHHSRRHQRRLVEGQRRRQRRNAVVGLVAAGIGGILLVGGLDGGPHVGQDLMNNKPSIEEAQPVQSGQSNESYKIPSGFLVSYTGSLASMALREQEKQKVEDALRGQLQQKFEGFNQQHETLGALLGVSFKFKGLEERVVMAQDSPGVASYIANAKAAINAGFAYWDHPHLKVPKFEFVVGDGKFPEGASEFISRDVVPIYVLSSRSVRDVNLEGLVVFSKLAVPLNASVTFGGLSTYKLKLSLIPLKGSDAGYDVVSESQGIWLTLTEDSYDAFHLPAEELLHYQMWPFTLEHIRKDFNDNDKRPKTLQEAELLIAGRIQQEEYFVHGLGMLFLEERVRSGKLPPVALIPLGTMSWLADLNVIVTSERIRQLGVTQALDAYISTPQLLFPK